MLTRLCITYTYVIKIISVACLSEKWGSFEYKNMGDTGGKIVQIGRTLFTRGNGKKAPTYRYTILSNDNNSYCSTLSYIQDFTKQMQLLSNGRV